MDDQTRMAYGPGTTRRRHRTMTLGRLKRLARDFLTIDPTVTGLCCVRGRSCYLQNMVDNERTTDFYVVVESEDTGAGVSGFTCGDDLQQL